jgi:hypothetical protein
LRAEKLKLEETLLPTTLPSFVFQFLSLDANPCLASDGESNAQNEEDDARGSGES